MTPLSDLAGRGGGSAGSRQTPPVAVLWDQSLIWGVICRSTLQELGIPFHLLQGRDIAAGCLEAYRVLVVPGGWASHKIQALGRSGADHLRRFLQRGGSYLGFCGGAGLALSSPPSLGMVPLKRLPLAERVPSASGHFRVRRSCDHPAWEGLPDTLPVSVWWPSQFAWRAVPGVTCLARYDAPGDNLCMADLPVADLAAQGLSWQHWEEVYGINLDPARLLNEPALIECRCGNGRLILSYPHPETPGDTLGNQLFGQLLRYLAEVAARPSRGLPAGRPAMPALPPRADTLAQLEEAVACIEGLIRFGENHLLWNWRLPWLLHWRRGIRGLEYGSLAVLVAALHRGLLRAADGRSQAATDPWAEPVRQLSRDVERFCRLARQLLLEEKFAGQRGQVSKIGKVSAPVDRLREELFGLHMRHGGLCQVIFDRLDRLLFQVFAGEDG